MTIKINFSEPAELESGIPRSAKYGAATETFVVRKVVVLSMRVGLQSLETTCVFVSRSGSFSQQFDEQSIKCGTATYQLPSRIEMVVMVVDYEVTVTVVLIMLIAADLVEGASAGIQHLNIP